MAENYEDAKVFKNYPILPPELRTMIIDEMEKRERCRFTRCSKWCGQEAKRSKNYMYGVMFNGDTEDLIEIYVKFEENLGYLLKLERRGVRKYMIYRSAPTGPHYYEELHHTTDLVEEAASYFINLAQLYQNSIKVLRFQGELLIRRLRHARFDLNKMRNLEILGLEGTVDLLQFMPTFRHPLRMLCHMGRPEIELLEIDERIYQVTEYLCLQNLKLNNEQFVQLSAAYSQIHIGSLTPENIVNFIRDWQHGKLRANFHKCSWNMFRSNFDMKEVLRLLGVEPPSNIDIGCQVMVKHKKDARKIALLYFSFIEMGLQVVDVEDLDL